MIYHELTWLPSSNEKVTIITAFRDSPYEKSDVQCTKLGLAHEEGAGRRKADLPCPEDDQAFHT